MNGRQLSYVNASLLCAIAALVLLVAFVGGSIFAVHNFDWSGAISDVGAMPGIGVIFNLGLIGSAIAGMAFHVLLTYIWPAKSSIWARLLFILAFLLELGIGLVPYTVNQPVHHYCAFGFLFVFVLAAIVFAGQTWRKDKVIATGILGFSALGFILLWVVGFSSRSVALAEVVGILCLVGWVLTAVYRLVFLRHKLLLQVNN